MLTGGGEREAAAADDVADVRHTPRSDQVVHVDEALEERRGHGGRVAREELAARHEDEEQVDGKERREDELLQARVGRRDASAVASNDRREETTEADVAATHDGLVQDLDDGHLGVVPALGRHTIVRLLGRFDRRNS